jgi:two-component system sensor histidine kinase BaeS
MHLEALERETERLSHLVDSMLELARLDGGLIPFACEKVDVVRLAADAIIRYEPSARARHITLALTDRAVPAITGDPMQLARAIGIVIDNALQHTPEGGRIEIRLGQESWTGGEYVTLLVRDTGMGIDPGDLPYIFNRFYRADRVRDQGIRGVGLGLAIAHEILSRHEGAITVESEPNRGSAFTLWLPCSP